MQKFVPAPGPAEGFVVLPLEEQFANHDEFRLAPTEALAGRHFDLRLERSELSVRFVDADALIWKAAPALSWGTVREERYEAIEVRPDLFVVTVPRLDDLQSALVVLDLTTDRCAIVASRIVERGHRMAQQTSVLHAGIGGATGEPFPRSDGLVGRRVHQRYSSTHAFEHIYLNPNTYAWHCLEGPERGLADVDPVEVYELGDELFLLVWNEGVQPFNGAVVVDLRKGRSDGRLFGWSSGLGRAMQARTGSITTLLNETRYDGL